MKNIVLIGMPGCGKSTTGVLLAKALGMDFLDTDLLIQKREGVLLQQLLNEKGMAAFLDAEEAAVLSVDCTGHVIATGGSVVYREAAMAHLMGHGLTVYLKLPCQEVLSRLSNIKTRGIAIAPGRTVAELYAERVPLYERYAQYTLDCQGHIVEETVTQLASLLRKEDIYPLHLPY